MKKIIYVPRILIPPFEHNHSSIPCALCHIPLRFEENFVLPIRELPRSFASGSLRQQKHVTFIKISTSIWDIKHPGFIDFYRLNLSFFRIEANQPSGEGARIVCRCYGFSSHVQPFCRFTDIHDTLFATPNMDVQLQFELLL